MNINIEEKLSHFIDRKNALKNLAPSQETDSFFQELCGFCITNEFSAFPSEKLTELQKTCSTGEVLLEQDICQKVLDSDNPWEELYNFIYFQNYEDLSRLEYINISFYLQAKKILFLGAGPLPLSAIILAKNYNIECCIVDCNEKAYELGKNLIQKLGLSHLIKYVFGNAYEYQDNTQYDVCYVAALVWENEEKQRELLKHLKISVDSQYFLMRSSDGGREMLYKKVSLPTLRQFLSIQHIIHPKNHIVNSIIIAKKHD